MNILEIIAISESTPGAISVNVATFIGYRVAGFIGAFFSTLGLILPAFIIMFIISTVLRNFKDNEILSNRLNVNFKDGKYKLLTILGIKLKLGRRQYD